MLASWSISQTQEKANLSSPPLNEHRFELRSSAGTQKSDVISCALQEDWKAYLAPCRFSCRRGRRWWRAEQPPCREPCPVGWSATRRRCARRPQGCRYRARGSAARRRCPCSRVGRPSRRRCDAGRGAAPRPAREKHFVFITLLDNSVFPRRSIILSFFFIFFK